MQGTRFDKSAKLAVPNPSDKNPESLVAFWMAAAGGSQNGANALHSIVSDFIYSPNTNMLTVRGRNDCGVSTLVAQITNTFSSLDKNNTFFRTRVNIKGEFEFGQCKL